MTTTHTATVVAGTLQLDQPLDLPEKSRVTVAVTPNLAVLPSTDDSASPRSLTEFFAFVDGLNINIGEKLTRDQIHERG